ncbi:MAG: NADH-ubiquinone oxidoreductase-F iron-sulfur binding region domain-containing protein, partial [Martelella sp.]
AAGAGMAEQKALLDDLCNTMRLGSLCALGGFTPYPVSSALTHFPEDFGPRPMSQPQPAEAAE